MPARFDDEPATDAAPFLKWAGGKRLFLTACGDRLPDFEGNYLEPFLGGGATFFYLASRRPGMRARLSDINRHLIRTYTLVRRDPDGVYERLNALANGFLAATDPNQYYLDQRDLHNASHPDTDPARFIFLNRTSWNGLWRVNQRGHFNVPLGSARPRAKLFPTLHELRAASNALTNASIRCSSWENILKSAGPGDFAFVDPPYFSDLSAPHGKQQTKYHREAFTLEDHEHLASVLAEIVARGATFLLTNSPEPQMIELYSRHGFEIGVVRIPRYINSKADDRRSVNELVVTPGGGFPLNDAEAELDLDAFVWSRKSREGI